MPAVGGPNPAWKHSTGWLYSVPFTCNRIQSRPNSAAAGNFRRRDQIAGECRVHFDCFPSYRANRLLRLLALGMVALCAVGCVQRRMTIRTNPPGALVYIDNYEIGTTPVSTDFIYYGKRQIRLSKPGYETLTIEQPIPAPWFEWFPLDFISENLVPGEIRDERELTYQLVPQRMIPPQEILNQAEQLRQNAQAAAAPPPSYAAPGGACALRRATWICPTLYASRCWVGDAGAGALSGAVYPGTAVPGVQPVPPQSQPPLWMRMPPPTRGASFAPPPPPPVNR